MEKGNNLIVNTVPLMIKYLEQHIADSSLTVENVCYESGFCASYFQKVFKTITDKSILEYISELRINAASKQLVTTDDSIEKISSDNGFNSSCTFRYEFHRLLGCSPSEYRKMNVDPNKFEVIASNIAKYISEAKVKGMTINKYMSTLIINESLKVLLTTNTSVSKIAQSYGYSSAYYIYLFQEVMGMSPSRYRLTQKEVLLNGLNTVNVPKIDSISSDQYHLSASI